MGTTNRVWGPVFMRCILFLALWKLLSFVTADELSLVVGESSKLQLSPGLRVENSPGLKPGTPVACERIHIHGLPRFKNLEKYAHSLKVKVMQNNSIIRLSNVEVCFHRNASLGIGMCPQGQWEKVSKGSWVQSMSPFDHKLLDIRVAGLSSETLEVSIDEEFFLYRVIFFIVGTVLLSSAPALSKSLVFYYGSAMAIGVILVILMVLFQGMKLLPTGRKSSLAFFIYSSLVGLGSFLLRYLPGLLRSILEEIGIDEDMYNPLAVFLLAFVVLAGAWLGFWVIRKLVLTEDGSIDTSTSRFVAWSIRILAVIMILQSSVDPLLAGEALISAIMISSISKKITRLKFLRRLLKKMFKLVKKSCKGVHAPIRDSCDDYMYETPEDSKFLRAWSNHLTSSSRGSLQGITRKSTGQLLDSDIYPSTFHQTPERRKFSKPEWERFTKDSTKKAVEALVTSPDFGKWVAANADRISVTPNKGFTSSSAQRRRWFLWFSSS